MAYSNHSVCLLSDGTLWSFGDNDYGQLGIGTTGDKYTPTLIPDLTGVKQVVYDATSTWFLMNDGTVKAVGDNTYGQLGLGHTTTPITAITAMPGVSGVKSIFPGYNCVFLLMNDGKLKAVGRNDSGRLGLGNTTNPITAITEVPITGVKKVSSAFDHTMFLLEDGSVKAVGGNSYGQLGLGHVNTPVTTITSVTAISSVKDVECVFFNGTVFLMQDGTVKTVGRNDAGQLGLGNKTNTTTITAIAGLSNVKSITCGEYHIFLTMSDGTVKSAGDSSYGQLGHGVLNGNGVTTPTDVTVASNIKGVFPGNSFTVFLLGDGTIKTVGRNDVGQLGNGTTFAGGNATAQTPTVSGVKWLFGAMGIVIKFLLSDNGTINKIDALALVTVGNAPATEDMFQQGMDDLTDLIKDAKDTLTMASRGELGAGTVYAVEIPKVYDKITKLAEKV